MQPAKRDQRFYILVAQQASVGDTELLLVVHSRNRAGDRPGTVVAEDEGLRLLVAFKILVCLASVCRR